MDILKDMQGSITKALKDGTPFNVWKKNIKTHLKSKGWDGLDIINKTTGEITGQLAPHRLKTIFMTNSRTAYSVGRHKAQMQLKDSVYWRYAGIMDTKIRSSHSAQHGIIKHRDDPFWQSHYPPNAYNCRCKVSALRKDELEARGWDVTKDEITPFVEKSFDYNMKDTALWDKNGHLPTCWGNKENNGKKVNCLKIAPGQKTFKNHNRPPIKDINKKLYLPKQELLPKANSIEEAHNTINKAILNDKDSIYIENPLEKVLIKKELLRHIVVKREQGREIYSNFILPTLTNPLEIWATKYSDNGMRRHYIALFDGDVNGFVIVKIAKDGSLFWNFINIKPKDIEYLDRRRKGILLYAKS